MSKPFEICIPRVLSIIPREDIFQTFCKLKIGYIEKLVEIPSKTDSKYKRIILRLKLNDSTNATYIKTRLDKGEPVNIVYEMPWFWILKKVTQQK